MKITSVADIVKMLNMHGFDNFIKDLVKYMKDDFARWNDFDKSPRHAIHVVDGVIELMPIADKKYYSFKYVNGHPKNPFSGLQTVVATGQLSNATNGYPLMFSEMTILTALRTAAATILVTDFMARKDSKTIALIGAGAQSEFQIRAQQLIRNIETVKYYDIDSGAMEKFANNMKNRGLKLIPTINAENAVSDADIVIVCTACKGHVEVIKKDWLKNGVHINGLGGDCPGKTELEKSILYITKTVVEYLPQTLIEGDIQLLANENYEQYIYCEVEELITGKKLGRTNDDEITFYDSVGFALEDYSVLRLVYDLALKYNIGNDITMIPPILDPKNLISAVS